MARREAQALDARGVERIEHGREAGRAVQVAAVGVHVLAQKGDLLHAGGHIALRLGYDILERARLLSAAYVGHDAVRAEVVATLRDGEPSGPRVLARRRQLRGKRRAGVEHLHVMAPLVERLFQQSRKRAQVVRAEHHVQVRQLIDELLPVALPDAAAHGHDALGQRGAGAQRSVLERGHLTVEARVGGFAHAARHEHDEVGILDGIDGQRAQAFEHAGNALGIVFVHLAAERADTEREVRERGMRVHGDPQCAGADGAASASPPAAGMETPRV